MQGYRRARAGEPVKKAALLSDSKEPNRGQTF